MVNEARGEVELKLGEKSFVLCAEMARVAAWTAETQIQSVAELQRRVAQCDPQVLYAGARTLCISDNAAELSAAHFRDFAKIQEALARALIAGLEKNPQPPAKEKKPG